MVRVGGSKAMGPPPPDSSEGFLGQAPATPSFLFYRSCVLLPLFTLSLCRHHANISLWFNSVVNASWAPVVRRLEGAMKDLIPNPHLLVTHKPAPPLRAKWASMLWSILSGLNNEFDLEKMCPTEL